MPTTRAWISAFDSHVATFPEATGQDCTAGPSTGTYTINDSPAGRLLCAADNQGTVFFEWTDNRFGIITVATSNTGSYSRLYDWWANEAGPVESNGQPLPTTEPQPSSEPTSVPTFGEPTPIARPTPTPAVATEAPATPEASGEPGAGPKSPDQPYSHVTGASIHQVLFAAGIDPATSSPHGISDVFRTGTPEIDVLVAWDLIEVGAPLDVTLFQGDRCSRRPRSCRTTPTSRRPTWTSTAASRSP